MGFFVVYWIEKIINMQKIKSKILMLAKKIKELSRGIKFKAISKRKFRLHVYLLGLSIFMNLMIYVGVTQPAIDNFMTASYLELPEVKQMQAEISQNNALLDNVSELETETRELKDQVGEISKQLEIKETSQVVIREVVKDPYYYRRHSLGSGLRDDSSLRGALLVKDEGCASGYAWVNPRLDRWCAEEADFVE